MGSSKSKEVVSKPLSSYPELSSTRIENGVIYSSDKCPFSVQQLTLDPKMIQFILDDPFFDSMDDSCWIQRHDYPYIKNHVYHEAMFHAKPTTEGLTGQVDARYGTTKEAKPAAPINLRAFIISFKEANYPLLSKIASELSENSGFKDLIDPDQTDNAFADLAVQCHYGDAVEGLNLGWHKDNFNSVLHMAISLHGSRTLRLIARPDSDEGSNELFDFAVPQKAGNIYISSPWHFKHAVEYPKTSWKNRIIAVQARLLLRKDVYSVLYSQVHNQDNAEINSKTIALVFAQVLSNYQPIAPTLEQVYIKAEQLKHQA